MNVSYSRWNVWTDHLQQLKQYFIQSIMGIRWRLFLQFNHSSHTELYYAHASCSLCLTQNLYLDTYNGCAIYTVISILPETLHMHDVRLDFNHFQLWLSYQSKHNIVYCTICKHALVIRRWFIIGLNYHIYLEFP